MSGAVLGIGGLLVGCLSGIATVAAGAGEVAVKGGIATYEQFQIANDCSKAISCKKAEMKHSLDNYNHQSNVMSERLAEKEEQELCYLYNKLIDNGISRQVLADVQGTVQEKLVKLMALDITTNAATANVTSAADAKRNSFIRTPREIYNSISKIANPLLATTFNSSMVHKEIHSLIDKAESICMLSDIDATEKSNSLKSIETDLFSKLDKYKEIARNHEYLEGQFIGVTTALKKLAEYCGETVTIPEFNPSSAQEQIRIIQAQCNKLREKASKLSKENTEIIEVNKLMASIVAKSIEATGNKVIKIEEKPYGTESYHSFGSSVLKATTTNEGVISFDLLGKKDESDSQIKFDERRFCQRGLKEIIESLNNNGVAFEVTDTACLNENTILKVDLDDFDEDDETESFYCYRSEDRALYADSTGGY